MSELVERVVLHGKHKRIRAGGIVRVTPSEAERFKDKLADPSSVNAPSTEEALRRELEVANAEIGRLQRALGAAEAARDAALAEASGQANPSTESAPPSANGELPEDFPARAELAAAGITTLEQAAAASDEALLAVNGVGRSTLRSIREALAGG